MILSLQNLTLGYYKHPVVHHLNLEIQEGTTTAIIGPNGGGKSTLLKGIMGFIKPLSGNIISQVSKDNTAYLPQTSTVDKTFPITTSELAATGLWKQKGWFRRYTKDDFEKIKAAIQTVHMHGMEHEPLKSLSGGQIQRALFARLILQDANLILLDEPFNAIDFKTTDDLLHIIEHWKKAGKTIIAVLHNYQQVIEHFDNAVLLSRELIAYGPPKEVINDKNITLAFNGEFYPHHHAKICNRD